MDPSQRLKELFTRYQQRHCTPAEVEELVGLLRQAGAEEALTAPMLELWEEFKLHGTEYPVDWDKMYKNVSQVEDHLSILQHRSYSPLRRKNLVRRIGYSMVAALLLALLVPAAWRTLAGRKQPPVTIKNTNPSAAFTPSPARPETARRRIIHLPDGSTVMLNRNSRLDYTPGLSGATREVTLTGEGYFDIVHVPTRPFLVHTGKLTTRVLGTDFNIRAWPAEKTVEVTVTHGKVQVLEENRSMGLLTDAQQMLYEQSTEKYKTKKVDVAPIIAWRPQEVLFDDITMGDAALQIERRFGRPVQFNNPVLKNCRVTATFYEDDGLDEIMTVICGVSQSTYSISDSTITIDGKGCN